MQSPLHALALRAVGARSDIAQKLRFLIEPGNTKVLYPPVVALRIQQPALLMSPNWLGATDVANERASLLARRGYVTFVADMYGEGIRPKDFGEAAALANPLRDDPPEARRRHARR